MKAHIKAAMDQGNAMKRTGVIMYILLAILGGTLAIVAYSAGILLYEDSKGAVKSIDTENHSQLEK